MLDLLRAANEEAMQSSLATKKKKKASGEDSGGEKVRKCFFYGTLRDDDHSDAKWPDYGGGGLVIDASAKTVMAKVSGFKLCKFKGVPYPYAIRTMAGKSQVIGKLTHWQCADDAETDALFRRKLECCDRIEGYNPTPARNEVQHYIRTVVDVQPLDTSADTGTGSVKAYMYYMKLSAVYWSLERGSNATVQIPGGDWLNWDPHGDDESMTVLSAEELRSASQLQMPECAGLCVCGQLTAAGGYYHRDCQFLCCERTAVMPMTASALVHVSCCFGALTANCVPMIGSLLCRTDEAHFEMLRLELVRAQNNCDERKLFAEDSRCLGCSVAEVQSQGGVVVGGRELLCGLCKWKAAIPLSLIRVSENTTCGHCPQLSFAGGGSSFHIESASLSFKEDFKSQLYGVLG